ncbi:hypothetical protein VZO05_10495 [Aggregatilineales bacterium SYSU G02658]
MMPERLDNYLNFVQTLTRADRCLIVDEQLRTLASRGFDAATLESQVFMDLASQVLRHAVETSQPVITNNVITNPAEAPTTNTTFKDLRIVIGLPIPRVGALYMDRPVRHGVFDRAQLDRLMQFSAEVLLSADDLSIEDMRQRFQASSA